MWGGEDGCEHEWSATLEPGGNGTGTSFHRNHEDAARKRGGHQHGFCLKCGAWRGSLGLEPTIDLYLDHLVGIFRELKRVLRDDGVLAVNIGDSMSSGGRGGGGKHRPPCEGNQNCGWHSPTDGLKPLDLCGIPERFVLAMQADGWYWRSTVIWAKAVSFCKTYSGSTMPESVNGWRWERCRVKVGHSGKTKQYTNQGSVDAGLAGGDKIAQYQDCPGCPKCQDHNGYVLRKGSWRPTRAFEYIYIFTKTSDYYSDGDSVREENHPDGRKKTTVKAVTSIQHRDGERWPNPAGRNLRNVWTVNPQPSTWEYCSACDRFYEGSDKAKITVKGGKRTCVCGRDDAWVGHFATFSPEIVRPLIRAFTSEKGVCPKCGAQWARVVEKDYEPIRKSKIQDQPKQQIHPQPWGFTQYAVANKITKTLSWLPTCSCNAGDPVPATVMDIFAGSATTMLTAHEEGRASVGIELQPDYANIARHRLEKATKQGKLW